MTAVDVQITIINKLGLHARASAKFVNLASTFASEIKLARGPRVVDGKSIMGVMLLAAGKGTELTLSADGEDADAAIEALQALVADYFGEGE
ncbi:MAG: HPr family phosphocarrier protein [Gammaproteobacteria bacterium]|nr:HPr family phosphocarrier protein [Gammaproteobacteria bacterium]